ncbi:TrbI/VirB10 family protein [Achromobacter sp. NPDC058515]|uniref:TrbI/VirB10 family protein n=1 Tax=Achromobacter sp. NPDC058515 TaxID=3346533 RepID=UPI003657FBC5
MKLGNRRLVSIRYAPHDIRSTSGRVVLIDKGTRFIGCQQGVLAQGQPRIGVAWSRLKTPKGVFIRLDSQRHTSTMIDG